MDSRKFSRKMGCEKGDFVRRMSDQVMFRVLAARERGEEKNFWGSGMEKVSWVFQALLAARAWFIPFCVRSASGP
jgi:hypothetical protein